MDTFGGLKCKHAFLERKNLVFFHGPVVVVVTEEQSNMFVVLVCYSCLSEFGGEGVEISVINS